jgi:hypothetical protein
VLFSELIEREQLPLPQMERMAIVQGHCHHKSLIKFEKEESALRRIGLDLEVLDSAIGPPEQATVEERMRVEKRKRVIAGVSLAAAGLASLLYRRLAR